MKKSKIRTVIKIALLTFGLLSLAAGLINPLTYYFGTETTASFDNISFNNIEDDLYLIEAQYHYFANAEEYNGKASFEGAKDESLALTLHPLKYFPFIPSYGVLVTGYFIPKNSIIFSLAGFFTFILGLFVRTTKKEKLSESEKADAISPVYLCPACECEIDKDSIFCNYCGRKIITKG